MPLPNAGRAIAAMQTFETVLGSPLGWEEASIANFQQVYMLG